MMSTIFSVALPVFAAPGDVYEKPNEQGWNFEIPERDREHPTSNRSPKRLSDLQRDEEVRVIIHFDPEPALSVIGAMPATGPSRAAKISAVREAQQRIKAEQHQKIAELKKKKLISSSRRHFVQVVNGISTKILAGDVEKIASLPGIRGVTLDQKVKVLGDISVEQVGAPSVWAMQDKLSRPVTGTGTTIAIIDTGIDYTHPDLGGCFGPSCKVIGGYDFVNDDADPMDDHSHGTAVAGVAAASGTLTGVAPDAKLLAYKAIDADGWGYESDIIAAIEQAMDPDSDPQTDDAADVMNLSLGSSWLGSTSSLSMAADMAMRAGVVVVAAAGNEGDYGLNTIASPGSANEVITVGAVDVNGNVPSWSSRGLFAVSGDLSVTSVKPEIAAPGVAVETTDLGGTYGRYDGTSLAAPHVAGAAALLRQLHSELSATEIKALLVNNAASANGPVEAIGNGQLQVASSAEAAYLVTPPTLYLGYAGQTTGTLKNSSINVRSLSSELELDISGRGGFPDGVMVTVDPASFLIGAGGEKPVAVSVDVDPDQVPFPADLEQAYTYELSISAGAQSVSVPIAFHRAEMLKIQERFPPQPGYYWDYWAKIFDSGHEYSGYTDSYQSEEAALYIPVRDEPVTGLFKQWSYPSDKIFALEGVNAELGPVVVDPESNVYTINRPVDQEGRSLDFHQQMMRVSHLDRPEVVLWPHGVWGINDPMVNLSGFTSSFRIQYLGLFKEPDRSPADQKIYVLKSDAAGWSQNLDLSVPSTQGSQILFNLPGLSSQEFDLVTWGLSYDVNARSSGAGGVVTHSGPILITLNGNEEEFTNSTLFPRFDIWEPGFGGVANTADLSFSPEYYRKVLRSDSDEQRVSEILERPHGVIPMGHGVRYWSALLKSDNGAFSLKPDWNGYPANFAVRDSWGNHFPNDINYSAACADTGQVFSSGVLSGSNPVFYFGSGCSELSVQYDYPTFVLGTEYRSQVDLTITNLDLMQTPRVKLLELRESEEVVSYAHGPAELAFIAESGMPLETVIAEIGFEDGTWQPLTLEAGATYYTANLPDFSTPTMANLRISLSDTSGNSMENTINGAFLLGSGSAELVDLDGDGIVDSMDALPVNPSETRDSDGDGIGNNADSDDDNDGVADELDAFPEDPSESEDTDGDGFGNNKDNDDDNDGVEDSADAFPQDPSESEDTDADGIGNNADTDDDNDGVQDTEDPFPLDPDESVDSDGDGIGNNADTDDDNDGVEDTIDDLPLDPDETVDTDKDGIGNNADTDDDGDGVADDEDSKPLDPNYWDTLDASVTATSLSLEQSSAAKGDQDVVLQVFQLTTNLQTTLSSVTFKASGTGDESARVEIVRWYLNVNRDGSVDNGDRLLGEGNYDLDDGRLTLSITGEPLQLSAGEHEFIIAYDLVP